MATNKKAEKEIKVIPPWATAVDRGLLNADEAVPADTQAVDGEPSGIVSEVEAQTQTPAPVEEQGQEEETATEKVGYLFGRLQPLECPFIRGLIVHFHVGTKWGVLRAQVKDDDGMGWLRRIRMLAPIYEGWGRQVAVDPLTEASYPCPDPQELESYLVVGNVQGGALLTWILNDGWDEALAIAAGTGKNSNGGSEPS